MICPYNLFYMCFRLQFIIGSTFSYVPALSLYWLYGCCNSTNKSNGLNYCGPGQRSRYSDSLRAVRGSNPTGGEIFRTRPDRPWGTPSLLYNGYRVSFPWVKQPRRGDDHPPSSTKGKFHPITGHEGPEGE